MQGELHQPHIHQAEVGECGRQQLKRRAHPGRARPNSDHELLPAASLQDPDREGAGGESVRQLHGRTHEDGQADTASERHTMPRSPLNKNKTCSYLSLMLAGIQPPQLGGQGQDHVRPRLLRLQRERPRGRPNRQGPVLASQGPRSLSGDLSCQGSAGTWTTTPSSCSCTCGWTRGEGRNRAQTPSIWTTRQREVRNVANDPKTIENYNVLVEKMEEYSTEWNALYQLQMQHTWDEIEAEKFDILRARTKRQSRWRPPNDQGESEKLR
ncbi:unnamed protein product [Sphagnum tenellum]